LVGKGKGFFMTGKEMKKQFLKIYLEITGNNKHNYYIYLTIKREYYD